MSEQYTTTTDDVRLEYMAVRWGKNDTVSFEARAEFDRWLAAHDAEVAAKAVSDALESVRAERDAALASVRRQERYIEELENVDGVGLKDRAATAEARIAEAAKLHRPDWSDWGIDHPEEGASCSCGANYSYDECPTRIALGLNEGEVAGDERDDQGKSLRARGDTSAKHC